MRRLATLGLAIMSLAGAARLAAAEDTLTPDQVKELVQVAK